MHRLMFLLMLFSLIPGITCAVGQECMEFSEYPHWVNMFDPVEGYVAGIEFDGNILAVMGRVTGSPDFHLLAFEASPGESPELVDEFLVPNGSLLVGKVEDLFLVRYAFNSYHLFRITQTAGIENVAEWNWGEEELWPLCVEDGILYGYFNDPDGRSFRAYDIADVSNPRLLGSIYLDGSYGFDGMGVEDGVLCAANATDLVIVDFRISADPQLSFFRRFFKYFSVARAGKVQVVNSRAYVGVDYESLYVVDISNPLDPFLIHKFDDYRESFDFSEPDGILYLSAVTGGNHGVGVIDMADPSRPELVGQLTTRVDVLDLSVTEGRLMAAIMSDIILEFDVSRPRHFPILDEMALGSAIRSHSTDGDLVFLMLDNDMISVVDASEPTLMHEMGRIPSGGSFEYIKGLGDKVFAWNDHYSNERGKIQIWSVSTTGTIEQGGSIDFMGRVRGLYRFSGVTMVVTSTGWDSYDLSDPNRPVHLGYFYSGNYIHRTDMDDCLLFVGGTFGSTSGTNAVDVWDCSDFANPVRVFEQVFDRTILDVDYGKGKLMVHLDDGPEALLDFSESLTPEIGTYVESSYYLNFDVDDFDFQKGYWFRNTYGDTRIILDFENPEMVVGACPYPMAIKKDYSLVFEADRIVTVPAPCGLAADFGPGSIKTYAEVAFENESIGPVESYLWDFGDGSSSAEESPNHTYSAPGFYDVTLEVQGAGESDAILRRKVVQVLPPEPNAEFICPAGRIVVPSTVDFPNLSTGAQVDSVLWQFGDGGVSRDWRPAHQFTEPGDYEVLLQVFSGSIVSADTTYLQARRLAPCIISVEDVPGDEGGRVAIEFFSGFVDNGITGYYSVERKDDAGWVNLGSLLAAAQDTYGFVATTLRDSTASHSGMTEFRVIAHFGNNSYSSMSGWGFSVDNTPPAEPVGFKVEYDLEGNSLAWGIPLNHDFSRFRIYRSQIPDFDPAQEDLVHETTDIHWFDPNPDFKHLYYCLSVVDHSGNESAIVGPVETLGDPESVLPSQWSLGACFPNPANPGTTIVFKVPPPGDELELSIYDLSGKRVVRLDGGIKPPGTYTQFWNGVDGKGAPVPSGVYLVQLSSPGYSANRKVVIVR